jgi:hypothetical protein
VSELAHPAGIRGKFGRENSEYSDVDVSQEEGHEIQGRKQKIIQS